MAVPFRIGVMQLTMEPLEEMLASARVMDEAGMDTVWLAEAYPWWRKHQMEARGSTVVSALMARETKSLTVAWGIISRIPGIPSRWRWTRAWCRRPRVPGGSSSASARPRSSSTTSAAGLPRKPLGPCATRSRSCAASSAASQFEYDGETWSAVGARSQRRGAHAAGRAARVRRGHRAEDAGARRSCR